MTRLRRTAWKNVSFLSFPAKQGVTDYAKTQSPVCEIYNVP